MIGRVTQFIERRENGAEDNLQKGDVLIVDQHVLLDRGQKPRQGDLDRIRTGGKIRDGKFAAIIGEKLIGSGGEKLRLN